MVSAISTAIGSLVGCGLALGFILDGWAGLVGMIRASLKSVI